MGPRAGWPPDGHGKQVSPDKLQVASPCGEVDGRGQLRGVLKEMVDAVSALSLQPQDGPKKGGKFARLRAVLAVMEGAVRDLAVGGLVPIHEWQGMCQQTEREEASACGFGRVPVGFLAEHNEVGSSDSAVGQACVTVPAWAKDGRDVIGSSSITEDAADSTLHDGAISGCGRQHVPSAIEKVQLRELDAAGAFKKVRKRTKHRAEECAAANESCLEDSGVELGIPQEQVGGSGGFGVCSFAPIPAPAASSAVPAGGASGGGCGAAQQGLAAEEVVMPKDVLAMNGIFDARLSLPAEGPEEEDAECEREEQLKVKSQAPQHTVAGRPQPKVKPLVSLGFGKFFGGPYPGQQVHSAMDQRCLGGAGQSLADADAQQGSAAEEVVLPKGVPAMKGILDTRQPPAAVGPADEDAACEWAELQALEQLRTPQGIGTCTAALNIELGRCGLRQHVPVCEAQQLGGGAAQQDLVAEEVGSPACVFGEAGRTGEVFGGSLELLGVSGGAYHLLPAKVIEVLAVCVQAADVGAFTCVEAAAVVRHAGQVAGCDATTVRFLVDCVWLHFAQEDEAP